MTEAGFIDMDAAAGNVSIVTDALVAVAVGVNLSSSAVTLNV